MVHSNGTRCESQRLRIERTGKRKYSGRSPDFRRVLAGGEDAARRAMPTSGVAVSRARPFARLEQPCAAVVPDPVGVASKEAGGGQSAMERPGVLPAEPATLRISAEPRQFSEASPTLGVGLVASGQIGKSVAADCRTVRRRIPIFRAVGERTEDIAHLEARRVFRFLFAMSSKFAFCSPCRVASPARHPVAGAETRSRKI